MKQFKYLSFPKLESMITGVMRAEIRGSNCSIHYSDGRVESCPVSKMVGVDWESSSSIVSFVQSLQPKATL